MSAAPLDAAAVCRYLRSRSAYGSAFDEAAFGGADSPVESYWCLCTMEPVGPDDRLVDPHACCGGRACFSVTVGARLARGGGET